jgi:hypothetical protein
MDRRWVTSGGWIYASEAGGGIRRGLDRLQLCPFSDGSVLIGINRWFRCSGHGWIDVVCAVVDPVVEWCGIEVESVVWWLLFRRSAVGWGWVSPERERLESEREMKTKFF